MTDTPNVRASFLDDLRDWRGVVTHLRSIWGGPEATSIIETGSDEALHWRPRTYTELPENRPGRLRFTASALRIMARSMLDDADALDARANGLEPGVRHDKPFTSSRGFSYTDESGDSHR